MGIAEETKSFEGTTEIVAMPNITPAQILESEEVSSILLAANKNGNDRGVAVKEFLSVGLAKVFDEQNRTADKIGQIFEDVLNIKEIRSSTKSLVTTFTSIDNEAVNVAIKTIDRDLGDVKPLVGKLRDGLEGGVGFFRSFFAPSTSAILSTALQGLSGRIDSMSAVFDRASDQLRGNESILSTVIPEIGLRTAKIDATVAAIGVILAQSNDEKLNRILSNLKEELVAISGIHKESLARLLLLAEMNGTSKLVLKSTEAEVFSSLQPLIAENIIGANQKKVYELREKARAGLNALRDQSKKNIVDITKLSENEKSKLRERLNEISQNIDWVLEVARNHKENLAKEQELTNTFLPQYQAKISNLEDGIYEMASADGNFGEQSQKLLSQISETKTEMESRMQKSAS